MKKYLFPGLLVCLLPLLAGRAQAGVIEVHEVAYGSATVTNVSVSTWTGEQVDIRSLSARFSAELFNSDSAIDLYCSFDIGVSSISTSVHYGRLIAPGAAWTVAVNSTIEIYCISDSSSTEPIVVVTQLK